MTGPPRALVTGGAGFIGSHVVRRLVREGFSVAALDDLSMGKRVHVPPDVALTVGDVRDPALLLPLVDGADVVVHLAARVSIRGSVDRFHDDAATNVMGTLGVLEACRRAAVRPRRVVLASSMAVYGDADSLPIAETAPLRPGSPYGIGKMASEHYVHLVCRELCMESVALRYFNTYGERQTLTPYVGVITIFRSTLARGGRPTIFGDGSQIRDFIDAGDVAEATWRAAVQPGISGEAFNVGTGIGTSVRRIHDLVAQALGVRSDPAFVPLPAGEPRDSVADVGKARARLGFVARARLEEALPGLLAATPA